MFVLADALGHVGHGIHKGVFQQGDAVVAAVIALDAELVENLGVLRAALDRILVHALRETDTHVRTEQVGSVCRVNPRRYPPLAKVEVQLVERDRSRRGLLQGGKGFLLALPVRVLCHPCLDTFRLIDDVARDEAVFDLVTFGERIVEDAPFQLVDQLLAAVVRQSLHVVKVHAAIAVERGRQRFFGRIDVRKLIEGERNGMVEDVGLDELALLRPFEREDVASRSVHNKEFDVRFGVQITVPTDELVVTGVQSLALRRPFIVVLGFVGIEPLVSVAHGDIGCNFLPLRRIQIERVERSPVTGNVFQIADLITHARGVDLDERSFAVVRLQQPLERPGLHLLLVFALPLFRRELRFPLAHLPLDVGDAAVHIRLDAVFNGIAGTGRNGRFVVCRPCRLLCLCRCHGLCRRVEQRRLARLRQLGTVVPAAGLAARLCDAPLLFREAEQVVKAHYRRLYFGLLHFRECSTRFICSCRPYRILRNGLLSPQGLLSDALRPLRPCRFFLQDGFRRCTCRLLLSPLADTFERPRDIHVAAHFEAFVKILREHTTQIRPDALRTALMPIDHCGLAVGIGVQHRFRVDNPFGMAVQVFVGIETATVGMYLTQQLVVVGQLFFSDILLQDDEIATDLRSGIVGKKVVGQADDGDHIRLFEQLGAEGFVLGRVQHTLRRDERHDATVPHSIQPFEEKVVVDGFGRRPSSGCIARGERRIEDRHIPERDVGGRHVEIAVKRLLDTLEPLHAHFLIGVEAGENPARQEVFFKSHHVRASVPAGKGFEERPVSRGGFEHPQRAHMIVVQRVGQSLRNLRRGVERRQHGAFQAVDVTLVFVFACAVLADQTVQLRRHREQVEVGFRPLHGIGQVGSRVENTFQPSETAIAGKPLPLFGSGRPPCLAQLERRAYRLDVVPQFGLTVKCHPLPARLG